MFKTKLSLLILLVLLACKPRLEGVDMTNYDLYLESQYANGFAIIKEAQSSSVNFKENLDNYAQSIVQASVIFGELDLLNIKYNVIKNMASYPLTLENEDNVWNPLYEALSQYTDHEYKTTYALAYYFIFEPQIDYKKINIDSHDPLAELATLTAISRINPNYWHNEIERCAYRPLSSRKYTEKGIQLFDIVMDCHKTYAKLIEKMTAEIYPQLKALPQYRQIYK